jgi:hypothetical protein
MYEINVGELKELLNNFDDEAAVFVAVLGEQKGIIYDEVVIVNNDDQCQITVLESEGEEV